MIRCVNSPRHHIAPSMTTSVASRAKALQPVGEARQVRGIDDHRRRHRQPPRVRRRSRVARVRHLERLAYPGAAPVHHALHDRPEGEVVEAREAPSRASIVSGAVQRQRSGRPLATPRSQPSNPSGCVAVGVREQDGVDALDRWRLKREVAGDVEQQCRLVAGGQQRALATRKRPSPGVPCSRPYPGR